MELDDKASLEEGQSQQSWVQRQLTTILCVSTHGVCAILNIYRGRDKKKKSPAEPFHYSLYILTELQQKSSNLTSNSPFLWLAAAVAGPLGVVKARRPEFHEQACSSPLRAEQDG